MSLDSFYFGAAFRYAYAFIAISVAAGCTPEKSRYASGGDSIPTNASMDSPGQPIGGSRTSSESPCDGLENASGQCVQRCGPNMPCPAGLECVEVTLFTGRMEMFCQPIKDDNAEMPDIMGGSDDAPQNGGSDAQNDGSDAQNDGSDAQNDGSDDQSGGSDAQSGDGQSSSGAGGNSQISDGTTENGRRSTLVIVGDTSFNMLIGETRAISVRYVDNAQEPLSDRPVTLSNLGEQMRVTAVPGRTAQTDENGIATFTLTAVGAAGVVSLRAVAPNAEPVRWTITTVEPPVGRISVDVVYEENIGRYRPANFQSVSLRLVEGRCDEAPEDRPGRRSIEAREIRGFNGMERRDIDDVPTGVSFSAIAEVRNEDGNAYVMGCEDNIRANSRIPGRVTVYLYDLPVTFDGTFDVEHQLNLSCLLRGVNQDELRVFVRILRLLTVFTGGEGEGDTPLASAHIEYLCDIGEDHLGLDVPPEICNLGRGVFGQLALPSFERQLEASLDNRPRNRLNLALGMSDLWRSIDRIKAQGQIEFTQALPDEEGYLRNNETRWNTFHFVWGLDEGGPACPFDNAQLCVEKLNFSDNMGRPTPFKTTFTAATMGDSNSLTISDHEVAIDVGHVFLTALEQWYFKYAFEKTCVVDADCWVGAVCDVVGDHCRAHDGQSVPLSEVMGQIAPCEVFDLVLDAGPGQCARSLVPLYETIFRTQLMNLTSNEAQLTLGGRVDFADSYPNLQVDRLYNGRWNGRYGVNQDVIQSLAIFDGLNVLEAAQAMRNLPADAQQPLLPANCGQ